MKQIDLKLTIILSGTQIHVFDAELKDIAGMITEGSESVDQEDIETGRKLVITLNSFQVMGSTLDIHYEIVGAGSFSLKVEKGSTTLADFTKYTSLNGTLSNTLHLNV